MNNTKDKTLKINVDEDTLKFLKFSYFGDLTNLIEAAVNRAYRDMCRTLNLKDISEAISKLKEEVKVIFENENKKHILNNIKNQDDFDTWHRGLCDKIIKKSKKIEKYKITKESNKKKIQLTYGQVQKWVNMTIKYLFILEVYSFDNIFGYLHIPVDKYILEVVEKELGIKRPVDAWSRWDNYDEYLKYQNDIREKICITPLRWEFKTWLEKAQEDKMGDKKQNIVDICAFEITMINTKDRFIIYMVEDKQ